MKVRKKQEPQKQDKQLEQVDEKELEQVNGGALATYRYSRYNDDDYGNRTGG